MDYVIRFIIMILCGAFIPYIANIIYEPLKSYNELNAVEKLLWACFYIFIANWLMIAPSIVFLNCFKYIFIR